MLITFLKASLLEINCKVVNEIFTFSFSFSKAQVISLLFNKEERAPWANNIEPSFTFFICFSDINFWGKW